MTAAPVPVSAATVKRDLLDPCLEARALNIEQSLLVFDPSPERDSLAEHLNALATIEPSLVADAMRLLTRLLASNQLEGVEEQKAAGAADDLARALHRGRNGRVVWSVKRLAGELRSHLAVIAAPCEHDALAFVAAVRRVDELRATVPAGQLLSPSLAKELGAGRYRLLRSLVEDREAAA